MDLPVRLQRTTAIEPRAEQQGLPEVAHHGNVGLQPGGPQLGKRLGHDLVVKRPPVKTAQSYRLPQRIASTE